MRAITLLLAILLCLDISGCKKQEKKVTEPAGPSSNVLKDYIVKPKEKASAAKAIVESQQKEVDQQMDEMDR